ncbi:MAG: FMN-binding protein [Maribacter sp.]|nr:FMN-binding protein [Maribacter sp.]
MKTKLILLILVCALCACKENVDTSKPRIEEAKQEAKERFDVAAIIKELATFADTSLTESEDGNQLIEFKEDTESGAIQTIDMQAYLKLYKAQMQSQETQSLPIFEIKNTNKAVLMVKGNGFGGPIWAKVLVDRTTREIKKIEFGHKVESEGYGAGITNTSFKSQFTGVKIDFEKNSFGLRQSGKKLMAGNTIIDGISGATATSTAAVTMVNEGLQKYRNYLNP